MRKAADAELVDTVIRNNPEPLRATLCVLAEKVDRWVAAQDRWNSVRWRAFDDPEVESAGTALVDASDDLRKMVRR